MYRHLLVPTDGSDLSVETVGKAVEFARSLGAKITFLSARRDYGATDGGALERTLNPGGFVEHAAGEAKGYVAQAEAEARMKKVQCQSVVRTADRPYEAIIEAAKEQGCDLIFMASHGRRGLQALVLGSQTQKVLAHSPIPVLVSMVESNKAEWKLNPAVVTIHQEHLSLSAVIHALRFLVQDAHSGENEPDIALFRAIMRYIHDFPETLHHPKEEMYLFRKLREHTHDVDEVLEELERQHKRELVLVDILETSLERFATQGQSAFAELSQAVDAFAEAVWAHMSLEERVVIPAAMKHLTADDWAEVAAAFAENGDPCFDHDTTNAYKKLFTRIMNLAPDAVLGHDGNPTDH